MQPTVAQLHQLCFNEMMENWAALVLIEDNPDDAELTVRALKKAEVRNYVIVLNDGEKAVDYVKSYAPYHDRTTFPPPGLFILDLKLPRISGFEVLQAIRANHSTRTTPVIILTSSNQDSDINTAYELGANSYLTKPMNQDSLGEMMVALAAYWIELNKAPR